MNPGLWVFRNHIEYNLWSLRQLERDDVEVVDLRRLGLDRRLLFKRQADNSFVEVGFRKRDHMQEALAALWANGFPLSDRALVELRSGV